MQKNGIRPFSSRCTLKRTWWPLTQILTVYEVTQLGNRAKSVMECLLISIILVAFYSTNMPANPRISSQTTTLNCTWWPLTPIFTFIEVTKLGNMAKSVQEYLLPSKNQVALYSAKVPINPKIASQTTNLKCTWWLLTPIVTQLGNRTKSVQELPMAPNCQLLLTPVFSIILLCFFCQLTTA